VPAKLSRGRTSVNAGPPSVSRTFTSTRPASKSCPSAVAQDVMRSTMSGAPGLGSYWLTTKLRAFGVVGCGTEAHAITTAAFCAIANGAALKIANAVRTLASHL
jgi:hypothetical protein